MNIARIATTIGLGAAGTAVLAACSSSGHVGKTVDAVADDLVARYDKNGDLELDLTGESVRAETLYDEDGDGHYDDEVSARWSIAALTSRADARGDRNGSATADELSRVIRDFDTGGRKSTAGDGMLGRAEAESFDRSYVEREVPRRTGRDHD